MNAQMEVSKLIRKTDDGGYTFGVWVTAANGSRFLLSDEAHSCRTPEEAKRCMHEFVASFNRCNRSD